MLQRRVIDCCRGKEEGVHRCDAGKTKREREERNNYKEAMDPARHFFVLSTMHVSIYVGD
jgi:hypothetical protein